MQLHRVPLLLACTALLTTAASAQPGHRPGAPGAAPAPHAAPAPVSRAAPAPMPHAAAPAPRVAPQVAAPRAMPQLSPPRVSSAPRAAPRHVERPAPPPATTGRSAPSEHRTAPAQPSAARPAPPQPSKQLANRPVPSVPSAHTPAPPSTQGLATRQPQSTAAARNLGAAARPNITNPQARAVTPPVGATAAVAAAAATGHLLRDPAFASRATSRDPRVRALAQSTFQGSFATRFPDWNRKRVRFFPIVIGFIGPLFWPFAEVDFIDFTFYPYAYDAFWPYADTIGGSRWPGDRGGPRLEL